jgi:hypothetical protein
MGEGQGKPALKPWTCQGFLKKITTASVERVCKVIQSRHLLGD